MARNGRGGPMVMTVCLLTIAFWMATASQPALSGSTFDTIRSSGVLRVGTTGDYKPFSFRDADGHYAGADIEMAEDLARSLDLTIAFVPTTWGRLNADFTAGRFDIAVGGVTKLPERASLGNFTVSTYVDGKRPIARCADRERFTSIAAIDRPEVRVVVNPGASNEAFARAQFPHAQLAVHDDNASVFEEIVAGRADVMVTDGIEVDHQAHLHPELCPADVPQAFTRLEKAFWVQKDPELLRQVDTWLEARMKSGEWTRILDRALAKP